MATGYAAVIFDVGGVLVSPPQAAILAYEEEIKVPHGSVSKVFIHNEPDNAFCQLERGKVTLSQFVPKFEKECCDLSIQRNVNFGCGFSAKELFSWIGLRSQPVAKMLAAARILRHSGYKTCALTNNWIDENVDLQSLLGEDFDLVLESCKLGIRKPDPVIFQVACEKLGVKPSEVIFLDDLGKNLKAAQNLGMTTIKVKTSDDAIQQLEKRLQKQLIQKSKL